MDLETAADELYGVDPDEFVPTRTRLVQQARAAKDRPLATAIAVMGLAGALVAVEGWVETSDVSAIELGRQAARAKRWRDAASLLRDAGAKVVVFLDNSAMHKTELMKDMCDQQHAYALFNFSDSPRLISLRGLRGSFQLALFSAAPRYGGPAGKKPPRATLKSQSGKEVRVPCPPWSALVYLRGDES